VRGRITNNGLFISAKKRKKEKGKGNGKGNRKEDERKEGRL
jgi:hypothetical protein